MTQVVFLGPTLAVAQARAVLDAVYLPPVAGSDVLRALRRHRPAAIGIVDGLFEQVVAVRHKEILYALDQGVRVYGASSLGALRAAELAAFGMVGVGHVFDAFLDGRLERDDEVAVSHGAAEDDYRSLSDALVNIRWGLEQAADREVIGAATHADLLARAQQTFYAVRSWHRLAAETRAGGADPAEVDRLLDFVAKERPDRKRADALALLRRMREDEESGRPVERPPFDFQRTSYFSGWLQAVDAEIPAPTG